MTVSDHGRGFELARTGRGVARMGAALAEAGGSLSVNSVAGEGTTVTAVVPRARKGAAPMSSISGNASSTIRTASAGCPVRILTSAMVS